MYVHALGQWIFYHGLHVVPTAWNAHVIALAVLNSTLMAGAVAIVYGWTCSIRAAAACLAVILIFVILNPPVFNSDWNPYVYVPTYAVFVIAAGSVGAGHVRDAWIFALTRWFLIHGRSRPRPVRTTSCWRCGHRRRWRPSSGSAAATSPRGPDR